MSYKDLLMPLLEKRKKVLENTIRKASQGVNPPVKESLIASVNRNHFRYYIVEAYDKGQERPKRKYLSDIEEAKKIAKYDYSNLVYKRAESELKLINALIKGYQRYTPEECFQYLHPGRKALVDPYLLDDESYAMEWLLNAGKQIQYNSYPMNSPIQTENNEIVRSKSEKIIADKLKLLGVPYVYEKPLILGNMVRYPDFTALNIRTRKEFYWEHMGMMDQPDYFEDAMSKLRQYSEKGIWVGKNLIITYETANHPLDVKLLEKIIQEYLL